MKKYGSLLFVKRKKRSLTPIKTEMTNETFIRFQQGDETAFKTLFYEYSPSLLAFARRFVQEEEVEDVVQDIFMQIWNHRQEFKNPEAIRTYLFTSVKHRCLNILRSEDTHHTYLESLSEEDFYDQMLDVEVYTLLYRAISELPDNYKKVINYSLDGYHIDEIAEQMHMTVDAVKAYKKRAKEQLRKKMGTLYGSSFTAMLLLDVFLEKL